MKRRILGLILPAIMLMMLVCSVGAAEWVEVTRFTGTWFQSGGEDITPYFTCDHVDWRIRWEYTPADRYGGLVDTPFFIINIYERNQIVDTITAGGEVEVALSWRPSVETFASDPEKKYLVIMLDGNITNLAEFPVYNIKLLVKFAVATEDDQYSSPFYRNEIIDIDTISANRTWQISEIFVYEVSDSSTGVYDYGTHLDYEIDWDQSELPNGVSNIYGRSGTFYLEIITNQKAYTIIVEQNINSIPELTSFALTIALITGSISAIMLSKRAKNRQ